MDNIFTIHQFRFEIQKINQPIYLIPIGDIHRFASLCDEEKWHEFLDWAKKKKNIYFLGMGDYLDLASYNERKILGSSQLHDFTFQTLDKLYKNQSDEFIKEISFMRGKLIGMIEGNHHGVFSDSNFTTTQYMCQQLKCKYLGVSAFIRLSFVYGKKHCAIDLWTHHGRGASRLVGGSLNTVQQMADIADADIYLCVSEDTDILGEDGWKSIGKIKSGDNIKTFNLETNLIETKMVNFVVEKNSPQIIKIKNSLFDMALSPEHKMVYRFRNSPKWLLNKAEKVSKFSAQLKIPVSGNINSKVELTDSEICLAGWIISEGSFLCSGIRINQKNELNTKLIEQAIMSCGYKFSQKKRIDGMNVFYIIASEKEKILKYVQDKNIPDWAFHCSEKQFDILVSSLMLGDGHWCNIGKSGAYYSKNENLIDRLQIACLLHGWSSKKVYKKGGFKDGGWVLSICKRTVIDTPNIKNKSKLEHYDKKVWCVNTDNNTIICRRNGTVFITGNCGHDHKKSIALKNRLTLTGSNNVCLSNKKILLGRTGSFLKGYLPEAPSYVAKLGLSPTDMGVIKIELTPKRSKNPDSFYIDIHGSI